MICGLGAGVGVGFGIGITALRLWQKSFAMIVPAMGAITEPMGAIPRVLPRMVPRIAHSAGSGCICEHPVRASKTKRLLATAVFLDTTKNLSLNNKLVAYRAQKSVKTDYQVDGDGNREADVLYEGDNVLHYLAPYRD